MPPEKGLPVADEDDDAERLLADAIDDEDSEENEPEESEREDQPEGEESERDDKKLGAPGERALERIKTERNKLRDEADRLRKKVKEYEDKDKSESQRLQEAAEEAKTRASKAESTYRKMQVAMDRAPEHATLAHIRAVAKRLSGDSDEEMEADADEMFGLFAPVPSGGSESTQGTKKMPRKPRETLRGGGDPDEDPEPSDPKKLADLIGRR